MTRGFVIRTVLVAACLAAARPAPVTAQAAPLTETERNLHLLNRATYGARTQDIDEVVRLGRKAWLERQLQPVTIDSAAADIGPSSIMEGSGGPTRVALTLAVLNAAMEASIAAPRVMPKLTRSIETPRQLEEVMTDFWFNHFNVSIAKQHVAGVIESYEEVAIRRNVFEHFEDMLLATARHPAMLFYLDNYLSGSRLDPTSPNAGKLNENYARELLELHTLGVDAGYTQQDVIEVARAFTGWTVEWNPNSIAGRPPVVAAPGRFLYVPAWHDTGEKRVLGKTLTAGRHVQDAADVIHLLAHHPATARHIATKLVRYFVSDEPRPELVERLAQVFLQTDGDLREVTRTLFTSEEFYARENYRAKIRRPFEYVAAAFRLSDGFVEGAAHRAGPGGSPMSGLQFVSFMMRLAALRHVPYTEAFPTGFPTSAEEWVSGAAMLERLNFAIDLTAGRIERGWVDAFWALRRSSEIAGLEVLPAATATPARYAAAAHAIVSRLLPGVPAADAAALEARIAADLATATTVEGTDASTLAMRGVAIALGSPAFQRY